jgi:hypothetical protein
MPLPFSRDQRSSFRATAGRLRQVSLRAGLLTAVLLGAVTACSARDARFNPMHFQPSGLVAPPDVVLPPRAHDGLLANGLYTFYASLDAGICCWISDRARLNIRKDRFARHLVLAYFFLPEYFPGRRQRLNVRYNDLKLNQSFFANDNGITILPVPPALRAKRGIVTVSIDSDAAFRQGTNHYAIVLQAALFE